MSRRLYPDDDDDDPNQVDVDPRWMGPGGGLAGGRRPIRRFVRLTARNPWTGSRPGSCFLYPARDAMYARQIVAGTTSLITRRTERRTHLFRPVPRCGSCSS